MCRATMSIQAIAVRNASAFVAIRCSAELRDGLDAHKHVLHDLCDDPGGLRCRTTCVRVERILQRSLVHLFFRQRVVDARLRRHRERLAGHPAGVGPFPWGRARLVQRFLPLGVVRLHAYPCLAAVLRNRASVTLCRREPAGLLRPSNDIAPLADVRHDGKHTVTLKVFATTPESGKKSSLYLE